MPNTHNKSRWPLIVPLLLVTLMGLSSCSRYQRLPDIMQDYHGRLARVLQIPEYQSLSVVELTYPSIEQRTLSIAPITMNLRDFYAIDGCALAPLIAQRNTALGKLASPSQRLIYEAQLIDTLHSCVLLEGASAPSSQSELTQVLSEKQAQYPIVWANLMQNSLSLRSGLGFAQGYIAGGADDGLIETKNALSYLLYIQQPQNTVSEDLENHLATIEQIRLPARLYRTTSFLARQLSELNQHLSLFNTHFTCETSRQRDQIVIVNNVMNQFFIQQIQPIASSVNRSHQQIQPLIVSIYTQPNIADAYKDVLEQQKAQYERYVNVFREHVMLLQTILQKCGMRPTA